MTAVRGIYAELQMSKRGKALKIEKDNSNVLDIYHDILVGRLNNNDIKIMEKVKNNIKEKEQREIN